MPKFGEAALRRIARKYPFPCLALRGMLIHCPNISQFDLSEFQLQSIFECASQNKPISYELSKTLPDELLGSLNDILKRENRTLFPRPVRLKTWIVAAMRAAAAISLNRLGFSRKFAKRTTAATTPKEATTCRVY
jgi:hypothetical protein